MDLYNRLGELKSMGLHQHSIATSMDCSNNVCLGNDTTLGRKHAILRSFKPNIQPEPTKPLTMDSGQFRAERTKPLNNHQSTSWSVPNTPVHQHSARPSRSVPNTPVSAAAAAPARKPDDASCSDNLPWAIQQARALILVASPPLSFLYNGRLLTMCSVQPGLTAACCTFDSDSLLCSTLLFACCLLLRCLAVLSDHSAHWYPPSDAATQLTGLCAEGRGMRRGRTPSSEIRDCEEAQRYGTNGRCDLEA